MVRAVLTFRRPLLSTIAALCALTLSAAPAGAFTSSGGAGGPSGPSNPVFPGGGGSLTTWNLHNVNAQLPWGQYTGALNAARTAVRERCAQNARHSDAACSLTPDQTYSLSRRIGPEQCSSYANASCILWNDYRDPSPLWGYRQHGQPWHPGLIEPNGINAWNIRIWREGVNQPIFERRVCVQNAKTGATDGSTAPDYQTIYWNCGTDTPDQYATNQNLAGMLQAGPEPTQCKANWRNSTNGTLGLDGKPASRTDPAVPGAPHPDGFAPQSSESPGRPAQMPVLDGTNWCY